MNTFRSHADTLDHLERAIAQRDAYRLMFRAALDALHALHTEPERYAKMQAQLRLERIEFVAKAMGEGR